MDKGIYDVEGKLGVITGSLNNELQKLAAKVKVNEITFEKPEQDFADVMAILNDCTLQEACTYVAALQRAVEFHRYEKTKEWKLKDMDVTLYE